MILVIDNYDSFTYNLVQFLGELGETVSVHRNDALTLDEIRRMSPEAIVVSPGPCTPLQAGISVGVIKEFGPTTPVLGVCLGHQAIGTAFGGIVSRAKRVMHGKLSSITHDSTGLFEGLPSPLRVMRYHSLVVEASSLPEELEVTAVAVDDPTEIHALRHRHYPIWGVQFHPESILTEHGKELLANFLVMARSQPQLDSNRNSASHSVT